VSLPDPDIQPGTVVTVHPVDIRDAKPLQVQVGPVLVGIAPVMADINDRDTMIHGCLCRFCAKNPSVTSTCLNKLGIFVDDWLQRNLKPLPLHIDFDFDRWVDSINHPDYRKQELRQVWEDLGGQSPATENQSHGKRETYLKYKPARGINSRDDQFKAWSGPIFHEIEEVLYRLPSFIKHIPEKDRPHYLSEMLKGVWDRSTRRTTATLSPTLFPRSCEF